MIWRRTIPLLIVAILGANASADVASTNSMDRYKVIVDKSPFRRFSDPVTATATEKAGTLTLQAVVSTGTEKKVCLRDSNPPNKMTWASEGESINGFRVEKIDAENRAVTLINGAETVSLKFPEKSPTAPAPMAAAGSPAVRPVYRNPRVAVPAPLTAPVTAPIPVAPPAPNAPVPAAGVAPATHTAETTTNASPTSLRRRILRQNLRTVQPPAEAPAHKEEAKEGEATHAENTTEAAAAE